ncbi:GYD domain-containing protein [Mesorhizobium helmanticense]|uniref:GYD family protein n=1 Tax=Mesorhizobium helmanticense TaxID=1776423 RepID=A0A2T4IQK3_9HYPH|nr:GYD domain-containing protein [Mesorhizobium helmanticense]PTE07941.1 GYD family protein [Mesorhizobium helmanticense]
MPDETAGTPATTSRLYISLMRLTDKGLAELAGSPDRRKVSEERVAALGGKSLAFYATLGAYDFVQVFEMPDNEAMLQYVLTARRDGFVEPLILPAFDPPTFGAIVERVLK